MPAIDHFRKSTYMLTTVKKHHHTHTHQVNQSSNRFNQKALDKRAALSVPHHTQLVMIHVAPSTCYTEWTSCYTLALVYIFVDAEQVKNWDKLKNKEKLQNYTVHCARVSGPPLGPLNAGTGAVGRVTCRFGMCCISNNFSISFVSASISIMSSSIALFSGT